SARLVRRELRPPARVEGGVRPEEPVSREREHRAVTTAASLCWDSAGARDGRRPSFRLLDLELRVDPDGPRHVEIIRRRPDHVLVYLAKLLVSPVALEPHRVAERLVARAHVRVDAEEAPQIQLARGFDLDLLERDALHGGLGDVADRDAGIQ